MATRSDGDGQGAKAFVTVDEVDRILALRLSLVNAELETRDAKTSAHVALVNSQLETVGARIDGIRQLVDERAMLTDRALGAAMASQQKALENVATSTADRFASVNEFRAQLNDQQKTFSTRDDVTAHANANAARITALEHRVDLNEGRTVGVSADGEAKARSNQLLLGVVGIVITLVLAFLSYNIGSNTTRVNTIDTSPASTGTVTVTVTP